MQFQFHLIDLLTGLIETLQFLLDTETKTAGHSCLMSNDLDDELKVEGSIQNKADPETEE